MPRPRTGQVYVERHGDHWDIRIDLPDGSRSRRACMPSTLDKTAAKDEARRLKAVAWKYGATLAPVGDAPAEEQGETLEAHPGSSPPAIPPKAAVVYVLADGCHVKIGRTSDFPARWRHYRAHNPSISFVSAWPAEHLSEEEAIAEARRRAPQLERAGEQRRCEWFVSTPSLLGWAVERQRAFGGTWERNNA